MTKIMQFIHTKPYIEMWLSLDAIIGPKEEKEQDGVGFLFKIGVTRETKPLDFLAEQLLLITEGKSEKIVEPHSNKVVISIEKEIEKELVSLDFDKRKINYIQWLETPSVLSAPIPEDVWDKEAVVEGLNVKWWSILKAVAVAYFGYDKWMSSRRSQEIFILKSKLIPEVLRKGNVVLSIIIIPALYAERISITGQGGNERLVIKDEDEDKYQIELAYMKPDEVYMEIGVLEGTNRSSHDFLANISHAIEYGMDSTYYFKYGESTGIAWHYNGQYDGMGYFLYDGVNIVGDRARILLGRDIFMKVEKFRSSDRKGKTLFYFTLFADRSRRVDRMHVTRIGRENGMILFREMKRRA